MPKLPEWKIERYLLGELPKEEMDRIDQLRAADAEFDAEMMAKIDRLQASNQEILAEYPAEEMPAKIRQRAGRPDNPEVHRQRPFFALPQVMFPAALAAALALFILFSGQFAFLGLPDGAGGRGASSGTTAQTGGTVQSDSSAIQGLEGDTGIRLKGMEPGIQVFRQTDREVEMLEPGARAAEGDLLQLGFVAPEADYAVLFSLDGRGVLTLHSPASSKQPAALEERGRVLLDSSYRLDDAPEYERFYLLTSTSELDADQVLDAVRNHIRRRGRFPGSRSELKSFENFADISTGQLKWYVFTLKK